MGGGGAMRAAAKLAGFGVANCGLRGVTVEPPLTAAARRMAAPPVSALSSSGTADDLRPTNLHSVSSPTHRAWSEVDDWEFAGGEEEALFDSALEQKPRLVFGGPPSLVEAQEATSDLKDALEKLYLSSPQCTGIGGSHKLDQGSGNSEMMVKTKSCLTSEKAYTQVPPKPAVQAFRFLSENPAAQNVVASIACDPNVWNAVMQNPALKDFLQSHKSSSFVDDYPNATESFADNDFPSQYSPRDSDASSRSRKSGPGGFEKILQNIKLTVIEMWSSLSDLFQHFVGGFGGPATYEVFPDCDGSARVGFSDKALKTSFIGLVVLTLVVVALKRG